MPNVATRAHFPPLSVSLCAAYMYLTPSFGLGQRGTYVNPVPLRRLFSFARSFCLKSLLTPVTSPPHAVGATGAHHGLPSPRLVSVSIVQTARAEPFRIHICPPLPNPTPSRVLGSLKRRLIFILHFNLSLSYTHARTFWSSFHHNCLRLPHVHHLPSGCTAPTLGFRPVNVRPVT